jgi:inorganic pyrophosphatase/exopolyphosphatase
MKVVTAGKYIDIDVLSCAIAYSELFSLLNKESKAVLEGYYTETITETIKSWNLNYVEKLPSNIDEFILVDVSDPNFLSNFVNFDKIKEVWDHRKGHEDFWIGKIGKHNIEIVGACATLIWEQFVKNNMQDKISKTSANLLYTAIFSNTLNFQAKISCERDKKAFEELELKIDLPKNWIDIYYKECAESIIKDPLKSIKKGTKDVVIHNKKYKIGQLELGTINEFFKISNIDSIIKKSLETKEKDSFWFLTVPCVIEGFNYIFSESEETKKILSEILDIKFENNVAKTSKLILRKEIMHLLYDKCE